MAREADIAEVLALDESAPCRAAGFVECRDPSCPDWGDGPVLWRHFHREA